MKNPGLEFPKVRVFGTVGWIASGLLISYLGLEASALTFKIAATASVILAMFSLILPRVNPVSHKRSLSSILGLDAFVLFKNRSYLYFFIASILLCIPLSFYYSFANPFLFSIGVENAAAKMTLGQLSELLFMLAIPFFLRQFGMKRVFLIAMACWVVRYLFFSMGNADHGVWLIIGGIFLHGICYDFFFVTGQIYTEQHAGKSFKNSAQGLLTFATYGLGMFIGSYLSGLVTAHFSNSVDGGGIEYNWPAIWLVPAGFAAVVFLLFLLLFKEQKKVSNEFSIVESEFTPAIKLVK